MISCKKQAGTNQTCEEVEKSNTPDTVKQHFKESKYSKFNPLYYKNDDPYISFVDTVYDRKDNDYSKAVIKPLAKIPKLSHKIKMIEPKDSLPKEILKQDAKFPGDDAALYKWIKKHIIFPAEAKKAGKVELGIHITDRGNIDSVFIHRTSDSLLNIPALSLVSRMPRWEPAIDMSDKPTDSWRYLYMYLTTPKFNKPAAKDSIDNSDAILWDPYVPTPQFPGGERCLFEWLANNPPKNPNNESGRVTLEFTVSRQGYIRDIEVLRGLSSESDAEAIRVVESMPRWVPAIWQPFGYVDAVYILPVTFRANSNK